METLFPPLVAALKVFSMSVIIEKKKFDLHDRIANEKDFFSRVITGDESWIF